MPCSRLFSLLALLLGLSACAGPGYYVQAVEGHARLMHQREDIEKLLSGGSADAELSRRLEYAMSARAFARDALSLDVDDAYTQFVETGRDAVSWNVIAAPEFSLEPRRWCFLVAGCVPYRGYFEKDAAERFARKLEQRGYDVAVAPAIAYSTLGWFDDPLLDTMFSGGETRLAGLLFHELAHRTLYVAGDSVFNESFATFVEETGVRLWLESRGEQDRFATWRALRDDQKRTDALVLEYRAALSGLYASGATGEEMRHEKEHILDSLCIAVRGADSTTCGFNNASLALRHAYRGAVCAFERLYVRSGDDMTLFLDRASRIADGPAKERAEWLNVPCSAVAPGADL